MLFPTKASVFPAIQVLIRVVIYAWHKSQKKLWYAFPIEKSTLCAFLSKHLRWNVFRWQFVQWQMSLRRMASNCEVPFLKISHLWEPLLLNSIRNVLLNNNQFVTRMNVGSKWLKFSHILRFTQAFDVIWISNNLSDTLKTHVYPETARVFHDHMKYWWFYVVKITEWLLRPQIHCCKALEPMHSERKWFSPQSGHWGIKHTASQRHIWAEAISFWYLLKWIWYRMYQILVFLYNTWL